jgi:hypothetical protein
MLRKADGYNSSMNMTLILSTSKVKRTSLWMHSTEEYMKCMLQPLACENLIFKTKILEDEKSDHMYLELKRNYSKEKCSKKWRIMS